MWLCLYSAQSGPGRFDCRSFVNRSPIDAERIHALESFASQASLAIESIADCMSTCNEKSELEDVTSELKKNKDLLMEAERYSALGHMAAQLAHSIRNPITAIGGTAPAGGKSTTRNGCSFWA